jgi:rhamnose utilization protein RhaD (predicted bifunctional aldolase and dehydrogenase)
MTDSKLTPFEKKIFSFSNKIGLDLMLVQGSGGNISWKNKDILWIKGSGTCLGDALKKNIFLPIDLAEIRQNISKGNFLTPPPTHPHPSLRPSIETVMHAMFPHKIVIHVHPVEALSHLVRFNPKPRLGRLLGKDFKWGLIQYTTPGAALSKEVAKCLQQNSDIELLLLENHGIVLAANDITQAESMLEELLNRLSTKPYKTACMPVTITPQLFHVPLGYKRSDDLAIDQLAIDPKFILRLKNDWAICPDHVLFLGADAVILDAPTARIFKTENYAVAPPFIFVEGLGSLESLTINRTQKDLLRAYYEIMTRQVGNEKLKTLTDQQVKEVINWEAEKHRKNMS